MGNIKVGAQLYTVRDFTQTPDDIYKTLTKIKNLGFDVIQVSGFGAIEPQKLADMINDLKLDVCATHTPYKRLTDDIENVIKEHKMLNCNVVGLGMMPNEFKDSIDKIKEFIKSINDIANRLYKDGLKFAYHNHNFEFEKYDNKTIMDMLIEQTDPQKVEFILDTYWLQAGGVNPVTYINKVANRMQVCHFKDMAVEGFKQVFAEIGNGNLDFHSIYKACENSGVKYIVIEQDICKGDPFDSLKISLDYMNKTF